MSSRTDTDKSLYKEEDMPGLDAINIKERQLYANQEPAHYATILPYELGGKDPLWAVDCYKAKISRRTFTIYHLASLIYFMTKNLPKMR